MPEFSELKTQALIDELERLKHRVRERDHKMGQRLKNPMGNPHPQQFWPMCAEAHKITMFNHPMYMRWYDFPAMLSGPAIALAVVRCVSQIVKGEGQYYKHSSLYDKRYALATVALFITYNHRCDIVASRMFGLDENSIEIEKYGPMFPEEISEAARRKEKYEQEYIRVKEGLFNFGKVAERVDVVSSHFYEVIQPGMSGYFAEQKAKQKKTQELMEEGIAQRQARSA